MKSVMRSDRLWETKEDNLTYPMTSNDPGCWWMGYAAVLEIIAVGEDFADDLKVGDIVFAPVGHKDYSLIQSEFQKIPQNISPEQASFKTLTEIAYNGFLDAKIKLMDSVVIFGLGTIGQLLVRICKLTGAKVTVVDFLESRLKLATSAGADFAVNPGKVDDVASTILTVNGSPADAVIEVSGNSKALHEAVRCVKKDGQVTVLSFYQTAPDNFFMGREFHHNRVVIRSSQIGGVAPELSHLITREERGAKAMNLLAKLNVEELISHRCKFDNYPELIKTISENPSETLSVLIEY